MFRKPRHHIVQVLLVLGISAALGSGCGVQIGTPQAAAPTSVATSDAAAPAATLPPTVAPAPATAVAPAAPAPDAGQSNKAADQDAANATNAIVTAVGDRPTIAGNAASGANVTPQAANSDATSALTMIKGDFRQQDGFVEIMGVLKNNTNQYIRSARVLFRFYDAQNKQVAIDTFDGDQGYQYKAFPGMVFNDWIVTERYVIPPGESSVFVYTRDMQKIKGQIASYDAHLFALEAVPGTDAVVEQVKIERDEELSNVTVTGQMRATGSAPCKSPLVIAGGYNKEGLLVKVDSMRLEQPNNPQEALLELRNGETRPFRLLLVFPYQQPLPVEKVEVWAGCSDR